MQLKRSLGFVQSGSAKIAMGLAVAIYLCSMFPYVKPYPYSDDWTFLVPLANFNNIWSWLFELHNDHRIPVQKAVQLAVLWLSGVDFRSLILLNLFLCMATAWCWIFTARTIRGDTGVLGDVLIPLILLGPGFNSIAWGFSFTFVASSFLISLAVATWTAEVFGKLKNGGDYSLFALIACAWIGANGTISSAVLGVTFFVAAIVSARKHAEPITPLRIGGFLLLAANIIGISLSWHPSSATETPTATSLSQIIFFALHMAKSWLGVYAITHPHIKLFAALIVIAAGTLACAILLLKPTTHNRPKQVTLFIVAGAGLTALCLVFIVALTRAIHQPWFAGLELHYGPLTTPIPIASWILFSTAFPSARTLKAGLVIAALAVIVYSYNSAWRISSLVASWPEVTATQHELLNGRNASDIANNHIGELYYVDTPEARKMIQHAINTLWSIPSSRWAPRQEQ